MKVAYSHNNGQVGIKGTLAIDLPSKEHLENLTTFGSKFTKFPIGAAFLNNKDQFNKKTGREIAESRLNPETFDLSHINIREDGKVVYHFYTFIQDMRPGEGNSVPVLIGLSTFKDNPNVHLQYMFFDGVL